MAREVRRRSGVTIGEVLVVIGSLTFLAALLLPAVQASREVGRRAECISNLRQIGLAMQSYVGCYRIFPPSSSFQSAVLPQLGQSNVYSMIDYSYHGVSNGIANKIRIAIYHCPSDGGALSIPGTNYAGNFGSGVQVYGYNGIIRPLHGYHGIGEDPSTAYTVGLQGVSDGLSNTAAVAEILIAVDGQEDPLRNIWQTPLSLPLPNELDAFASECQHLAGPALYVPTRGVTWLNPDQSYTGYNHVLAPGRKSCTNGQSVQIGAYTANSLHSGGVNLLWADAHGSFISNGVDRAVWSAIGSRNGNDPLRL